VYDQKGKAKSLRPLITDNFNSLTCFSNVLKSDMDFSVPACVADPINFTCRNGTFKRLIASLYHSSMPKKALNSNSFLSPELRLIWGGSEETGRLSLAFIACKV
jgi:hypothetical protein